VCVCVCVYLCFFGFGEVGFFWQQIVAGLLFFLCLVVDFVGFRLGWTSCELVYSFKWRHLVMPLRGQ
jgi:hypothetical protein